MELRGKVAIVTGASSGIGRAIAREFAAEGARVTIADVTTEPLEGGPPTADLIGEAAAFQRCDVSSAADIDALVTATVARWGRVDVMVNNAAIFSGTALTETSEADWARVMDVNMTGMFLGCKHAVEQMLLQDACDDVRGRIVNIGSQQGIVSSPRDLPYGVSKAGAIYITRQIAADYAARGIVCNSISPGKVVTGKSGIAMDPALLENARRRTPWPRLGRPEDIAHAAVWLASDRATFVTGANLVVDGGWLAA